jgi:hypothetical protein
MEIVLYQNLSERQAVTKDLRNGFQLMGSLRNETSVIKPNILIEATNPSGFNYCYISEFGRYYFIDDMTCIRTNLWRIECSVDVLMSFRDAILNLNVIVSDDTSPDKERYMQGDQWQTTVKTKTDIVNFPSGLLDSGQFILITAGGEGSV